MSHTNAQIHYAPIISLHIDFVNEFYSIYAVSFSMLKKSEMILLGKSIDISSNIWYSCLVSTLCGTLCKYRTHTLFKFLQSACYFCAHPAGITRHFLFRE